ncbi:MAG: DUF302 domain-containing protein [Acidiferrobacterales bacterium]
MAKKLPFLVVLAAFIILASGMAQADSKTPYPGTITVHTRYSFGTLLKRVKQSIAAHHMALVAEASASRGAAARGITIPGNAVLMVFRNDFAVRMLKASVPAGIEAPLRIYLTEDTDGTASLTYREPSAVFAPYRNPALNAMAASLDRIFAAIVTTATGR